MSILTLLSEDLLLDFLSTWCELDDLWYLDCAFCNHASRKLILDQLKCPQFRINTLDCWNDSDVDWFHVREIKFRILDNVNFSNFDENMEFSPKLDTSKTVGFMQAIDDDYFAQITEEHWLKLIHSLPMLALWHICHGEWLTDDTLLFKIHTFRLNVLMVLSIQFCSPNFSEFAVFHLATHCFYLQKLELLSGCGKVTEDSLSALISNNKDLATLVLKFQPAIPFTHFLFDTITMFCPSMVEIVVNHCSDDITISDFGAVLGVCKRLRKLKMKHSNNTDFFQFSIGGTCQDSGCDHAHDEEVGRELCVSNEKMNNTHEQWLTFFTEHCNWDRIILVNLPSVHFNSTVLTTIAYRNPDLTSVNLVNCGDQYTVQALSTLLTVCKSLNHLHITHGNHLSNADFAALFRIPNVLETVILHAHDTITTETIIAILASSVVSSSNTSTTAAVSDGTNNNHNTNTSIPDISDNSNNSNTTTTNSAVSPKLANVVCSECVLVDHFAVAQYVVDNNLECKYRAPELHVEELEQQEVVEEGQEGQGPQ